MPSTPFQVIVIGDRDNPTITEVNVRSGPNRSYAALFRTIVGTTGYPVLEVRADDQNTLFQGRLFQWFRVTFPSGQEGWVRDDLVQISGDGSNFGYSIIAQPTDASKVSRNLAVGVVAPGQEIGSGTQAAPQAAAPAPAAPVAPTTTPVVSAVPTSAPAPAQSVTPAVAPMPSPAPTPAVTAISEDTADRVRRAAFNITGGFEGGGYATYQTYDSGIISYGRFQFTLAAGSFITVINRYIERSNSPAAGELRGYMGRINAKDQGLRQDTRLKELCIGAASDAVMQQIQDEVAVEGFYQPIVDLTIVPRGITLPLSYALIFDTAINHGRFNHLIPKTEEVLGVPSKSRLGDNGVTEVQFTTTLANVRRDNLYALADKLKFPGLKNRGDFWVGIVGAGDWSLQGDAGGAVHFNGKTVQVKNP
ncbi:MAG: hypothetical protein ABI690_12835 [Chloroflexota bacterium]